MLNLQRGDLGRGALLFAYLLLIMTAYQLGKIARAALFLDIYRPSKLPYADVVIAVSVGFVVAGYVLISRKTNLRNLLIGSIVFYVAVYSLFWYLARFHSEYQPWLYPVFYVWIGIFGVLATAQVWTLANFVLTIREAKRVFSVVAIGAIVGASFGGLLAALLAQRLGTENLMLCMIGSIALCGVIVFFIWRQRPPAVAAESDTAEAEVTGSLGDMVRLILSSRYLIIIASVIFISSLVTKSLEWQFTAISSEYIPEKNAVAAFWGRFYLTTGLICLGTQLVFTSRVLRRFGIGPALFILPVALLTGEIFVLLAGTLLAAMFLRGSDQVLRYSIDKTSTELLYLPVSADLKIQAKSFIDTFIWRSGDGVSGALLALFADRLRWTPQQISWVVIAYAVGWLGIALAARREYVSTLRESIRQHRLDAERASAPVLDRSTTEIFAANLVATDPQELLYALDLFRLGQQRAAHPAIRDLLRHPSPEVRQRALAVLSEAGDRSVPAQAEQLIHDPDLGVRTEALLYLTHHSHIDPLVRIEELGDFPDFSIRSSMVAFLARPGDSQNLNAARMLLDIMVKEPGAEGARTRLEAARLLPVLPDEFEDQLRLLLSDKDPEVVRAAIAAVAKLMKRRFVPRVLDRIADPEFTAEAADALGAMGPRILGTVRDHFTDPEVPLEVRREIPALFLRMGSPEVVARILESHLFETDTVLRFRVIAALNKLKQQQGDVKLDKQMIESVLAAEIMGHYRSYQILGTLGQDLESDDPVAKALRETLANEVERIFRLLGLLYPEYDLHSAYFGVQSQDAVIHDNALEFLENVLKPQLRAVLLPLLDSAVGIEGRVRRANQFVGEEVRSTEEAVGELIASDDPWLKSCGAYAIGSLRLRSLAPQLDECLEHSDPLLREAARQAKLRLATAGAAD
ncbi:MAG: Npt1/Npt2 family nucleotide transporter [Candidatus Acidiferrales bacterium]